MLQREIFKALGKRSAYEGVVQQDGEKLLSGAAAMTNFFDIQAHTFRYYQYLYALLWQIEPERIALLEEMYTHL
jgi:hypothetical protein